MDSISLKTGQIITNKGIHQTQVGNMLEGNLNKVFVDQIEQKGIRLANELFGCELPHLIPYPKSKVSNNLNEYEAKIRCIVYFESTAINKKSIDTNSKCAIVWFQDNYAFPIDSDILKTIKLLPWNKIAIDYEW